MKWWSACILVAYSVAAAAVPEEIRVYLNPEAPYTSAVYLGNVARIEPEDQSEISSILIPESLYGDGYLEASEVRALLHEAYPSLTIRVFGSAVCITAKVAKERTDVDVAVGEFAIQNGDRVDVVFRHKGITVRTPGTALSDGKKGERVFVKTANSKRLAGKIAARGLVEVLP